MLSEENEQDGNRACLDRWMRRLLRFAGTFNLFAGLGMIVLYHEGYRLFGIEKPQLVMPLQLTGMLVMLFGIGYHRVASRPVENYDLFLLGLLSKTGGSILGMYYVFWGPLPLFFLLFLFFADIIYLPFFWLILRRIAAIRGPLADAD
ncbi:unnamed protein product [marine sediment metagenome]|uniref:Uncharacterized protein n=1 Tax=marine sediment metagenome TaxID=412755 RepID=X0VNB0_9ZZZZ